MKRTMRKLRKATDEWWRHTWQEWRASGLGVDAINRGERKAVILEGWNAMRTLFQPPWSGSNVRYLGAAGALGAAALPRGSRGDERRQ